MLPLDEKIFVSPADGVIVDVSNVKPPEYVGFKNDLCTKVSIFLNVFDVHVNCIPISGKIIDIIYNKGKFVNASFDKASDINERNTIIIEIRGKKEKVAINQVAGLIARRIRCDVKKGSNVNRGDIFGIIRFGSRVDIYFENIITPFVKKGQRVRMKETPIYRFN